MSTDALLDEDYALDWRAVIEQVATEAGVPELIDSVRFLESLDPLVGADPDSPQFVRAVEALVQQYLTEADRSGGGHPFDDGTCTRCGY